MLEGACGGVEDFARLLGSAGSGLKEEPFAPGACGGRAVHEGCRGVAGRGRPRNAPAGRGIQGPGAGDVLGGTALPPEGGGMTRWRERRSQRKQVIQHGRGPVGVQGRVQTEKLDGITTSR